MVVRLGSYDIFIPLMNDPAASCEVSKNKKQIATDLSADRQVHRFNKSKKSNLRICGNIYFIHLAAKMRGILLIKNK